MKTIHLTRNLRKSVLQGAPWIYKEAFQIKEKITQPEACKVKDQKGDFLCWAFVDPYSSLGLRVLSTQTNKAPTKKYFSELLKNAHSLRSHVITKNNNSYRLINGEGDFLPGLVCDVYNQIAILQFDGKGPFEFWDQDWIAQWILENTNCSSVYHKPRHDLNVKGKWWGDPFTNKEVQILEQGNKFTVDILTGQKTGFFLDQRNNRKYIQQISKDKNVLNLFSYTGGFSIYAGKGEANSVTSVDISQKAIELTQTNWKINNLPEDKHFTKTKDVFKYIKEERNKYDLIICDPPSLAKAQKQKEAAFQKYIDVFSDAAKLVNKNGFLILSSCSSHINFEDFSKITTEALSKSRRIGQVLRVSGQGEDHPFPQACPQLRYLKFVSLKIF